MTTPHRPPNGRPLLRSALVAFALLLLPNAGCTAVKKDEPVEHAPQACCTEADAQLQHFKGCAVSRRNCRREERWWMRGFVTCGPVDEANCAGGRCCEYRPQYDAGVGEGAAAAGEGEDGGAADDGGTPEADPADAGPAPEAEAEVPEDAGEAEAPAPAPEADGEDPEAPLP